VEPANVVTTRAEVICDLLFIVIRDIEISGGVRGEPHKG